MTSLGGIPRKRLRWIPESRRLAHQYCYFLHDQCVALLKVYEEQGAQRVRFTFGSRADAKAFRRLADQTDSVSALRSVGRHDEARRVVLNAVTVGLVSDYLHHLFEALKCMEKRKFIVALNLLRKPLLDNLLFLCWMLGDEDGFYKAFTEQSPEALTSNKVGNRRPQIIASALAQTPLASMLDPADIHAVLFDAKNQYGLYWLMQRAVHLVTTQRIEFKTEPENFNFIFKSSSDDDVYLGVYETIPELLLFASHVIAKLYDRIASVNAEDFEVFKVRSILGYRLVLGGDEIDALQSILAPLSAVIQCDACEAPVTFTHHNIGRALLTESHRCTRCGTVANFPFSALIPTKPRADQPG